MFFGKKCKLFLTKEYNGPRKFWCGRLYTWHSLNNLNFNCLFRKFYLSCIDDEESSDEDNVEDDFEEEVIESHGVLAEQHEKPDDLLDNYFLPGLDDFEVQHHFYSAHLYCQ